MQSNRPEIRSAAAVLVAAVSLAMAAFVVPSVGASAGALESGDTGAIGADTPTTVVSDVGPTSECSPGHIVRRPNCGIAPESPTDPGGWLQLSLFFLVCAAVAAMIGIAVWRSRIARRNRRAAGLDPVDLARAKGQGVRLSTRSEPVAETSVNRPDATAGT